MGESERWWKSDHLGKMSDYQNDRPESRKCPSGQHYLRTEIPDYQRKKIVMQMLISNSHELFHEWDTLNIIHSGLFNLKSIEICKCQITKLTDQNRGSALEVSIIWRTEVPDWKSVHPLYSKVYPVFPKFRLFLCVCKRKIIN